MNIMTERNKTAMTVQNGGERKGYQSDVQQEQKSPKDDEQ